MTETDKIIAFYDEHERVPTYEEMKKLFGVKSKNTVAYKVKKLIEEGVLIKEGRRIVMGVVGGFMKLGNNHSTDSSCVVKEEHFFWKFKVNQ